MIITSAPIRASLYICYNAQITKTLHPRRSASILSAIRKGLRGTKQDSQSKSSKDRFRSKDQPPRTFTAPRVSDGRRFNKGPEDAFTNAFERNGENTRDRRGRNDGSVSFERKRPASTRGKGSEYIRKDRAAFLEHDGGPSRRFKHDERHDSRSITIKYSKPFEERKSTGFANKSHDSKSRTTNYSRPYDEERRLAKFPNKSHRLSSKSEQSPEKNGEDRFTSGKGHGRRDSIRTPITSIDPQTFGQRYHVKSSEQERPNQDRNRIKLTTAASTFIFGRSASLSCLTANRRKIYNAYINNTRLQSNDKHSSIPSLLTQHKIQTHHMSSSSDLLLMDDLSSARPHNGIILEVSPLPFPPISDLTISNNTIQLQNSPQSAEESSINSLLTQIQIPSSRQPFVLFLDGVLDEGNLGNILRTAHFYNVDAVAICVNTCAPVVSSSIVAKAASGAIEAIPLLRIDRPADFIRSMSKNKEWEVWGSVAPLSTLSSSEEVEMSGITAAETGNSSRDGGERNDISTLNDFQSPLKEKGCILMLGGEGEGLRRNLLEKANKRITISPQGQRKREMVGVDSLNVASAAAVLCQVFLGNI